jgi:cell division septation protein DedD
MDLENMTIPSAVRLSGITTLLLVSTILLGLGGCSAQQKLFGKPSSSTAWQSAYDEKAAAETDTVKKDVAADAPATDTRYYLQLAAYTSRENAEKQLKKMKAALKHPVVIFEESDNDKQYFKLQVGPFANLQEAVRAEPDVLSSGFTKVRYIRR